MTIAETAHRIEQILDEYGVGENRKPASVLLDEMVEKKRYWIEKKDFVSRTIENIFEPIDGYRLTIGDVKKFKMKYRLAEKDVPEWAFEYIGFKYLSSFKEIDIGINKGKLLKQKINDYIKTDQNYFKRVCPELYTEEYSIRKAFDETYLQQEVFNLVLNDFHQIIYEIKKQTELNSLKTELENELEKLEQTIKKS